MAHMSIPAVPEGNRSNWHRPVNSAGHRPTDPPVEHSGPHSASHYYSSLLPMNQTAQYSHYVHHFPTPHVQKRPRRKPGDIVRMYKCGWNGCEKGYGTLNHLNAHVTMQSHGTKRTSKEFKEIRKQWKAKKIQEENQRKDEEPAQWGNRRPGQDRMPTPACQSQWCMIQPQIDGPQLARLYQPAGGQAPGQYVQPQQMDAAQQYGNSNQTYRVQGCTHSPCAQCGLRFDWCSKVAHDRISDVSKAQQASGRAYQAPSYPHSPHWTGAQAAWRQSGPVEPTLELTSSSCTDA